MADATYGYDAVRAGLMSAGTSAALNDALKGLVSSTDFMKGLSGNHVGALSAAASSGALAKTWGTSGAATAAVRGFNPPESGMGAISREAAKMSAAIIGTDRFRATTAGGALASMASTEPVLQALSAFRAESVMPELSSNAAKFAGLTSLGANQSVAHSAVGETLRKMMDSPPWMDALKALGTVRLAETTGLGQVSKAMTPQVMDALREAGWSPRIGTLGSQFSTQLAAKSGLKMGQLSEIYAEMGSTRPLWESMRTLTNPIDVGPTPRSLRRLARLEMDDAVLQGIEEQLLADPILSEAFDEAGKGLAQRLKISNAKARRAVLATVWISWFSAIMAGLIFAPGNFKIIAAAALSGSGKLNADGITDAVMHVITPDDQK